METVTKRRYNRISTEHLNYARERFAQFASTSAVRAELKARGAEYSHSALHHYWHQANRGFGGKLAERACKCSLRTKLVGDGCEVCNPERHKEPATPGDCADVSGGDGC